MALYSYPITVEREGKRYYAYSDDFPGCSSVQGFSPNDKQTSELHNFCAP